MNVKQFKFKDIKKIAELVTKLDLQREDVDKIVGILTGSREQLMLTEPEVEKYLLDNVNAKQRKELYAQHDGDFEKLREFALQHKGVDTTSTFFDVIINLLQILASKFEHIAEFMAYYLEDYEYNDVMEFDEEQSVEAISAVFTDGGFLRFFSRLFNLKSE